MLGTIGSIPGAIVGSIIVGFVRALSSPVLIGVGLPLGRSNYSALDGVMPYIFLVAILMIMPEGIGDAYEKWKIDRLRKREASVRDDKIATGLAFLPTGIFGLHHWWRGRPHKAQAFTAIAVASYVYHRFSDFVGRNSFADGACSDACLNNEFAESNLYLLTGRNDGRYSCPTPPNSRASFGTDQGPQRPNSFRSRAVDSGSCVRYAGIMAKSDENGS